VSSFKKPRRRAAEGSGQAGDARQANFKERAFFTGGFELGGRHSPGIHELAELADRLLGQAAEFGREEHFATAFAFGVEDSAALDGKTEHFFQAEGLRAELGIIIFELTAFALLVFHRQERAIGVPFDDVTFAGQTEAVGEDGQGAEEGDVFGDFVTGQIGVFMDEFSARQPSMIFKAARRGQ
jgi:hypothetical protein